jgi:hypothetical protein
VDFFNRKNPMASVGSEPAILGPRGQHVDRKGCSEIVPSNRHPVAVLLRNIRRRMLCSVWNWVGRIEVNGNDVNTWRLKQNVITAQQPAANVQLQMVRDTASCNLHVLSWKITASSTKYSGPLTYDLNSFPRAGRNSSWS